jgi:uncharacterized protein
MHWKESKPMDVLIWGPIVRICQAAVSAGPTIVIGWLIAAILERILGRSGTLQLFGGRTWKQLPYAWLLGMLLPVCSLGVIPIMQQMRKSGISGGTTIAFGLTAPLFNPISVLYGLTLSDPLTLFVFCLGSLTIVTIIGLVWDWMFPNNWIEPIELPPTPFGLQRVGAVFISMCQQAASTSTLYIAIALVGVGVLAGLLPAGFLQHAAAHNDWTAPLTMAGVATLAYVTPMVAIVQVASMFQHGNSIGAAFTLLALGTGINLGVLLWSWNAYGFKKTVTWFLLLLAVVLTISYGVDGPLRPKGVQAADHTHAFDNYCNPFIYGAEDCYSAGQIVLKESTKMEDLAASCCAAVMVLVGLGLALFDRRSTLLAWMLRMPATGNTPKRDIILPNSVIAFASLAGLVVASIGACFLYYPPTSEIRKEMNGIQADIYSSIAQRDWDAIEFLIPQQEDWARKLVVSKFLRRQEWNRFQAMRLKVFLSKLEMLEHESEDHEIAEADRWNKEASDAFTRLKAPTWLPGLGTHCPAGSACPPATSHLNHGRQSLQASPFLGRAQERA